MWVMEYGSVCIATLWVNKNSFSQHLACLSRHICVCVIVCVCAVPLVASSLAELPASCPICSSHMVFSFSGGTSLSPFLPYFSYLCSVCPCFDSSLHSSPPPLHLSHPLPSPECVCVLFFFYHTSHILSRNLHSPLSLQIHFTCARASSLHSDWLP